MMMMTHRNRLRFFRTGLALLIFLCSANFLSPVAAQDESSVTDLAAMALNPLDLSGADIEGFGIRNGKFVDPQTLSAILDVKLNLDPAAFTDTMTSNGFTDAYTLELADPEVMGDPSQGLNGVVSSTIIEFGDEARATAAFGTIATTATFEGSTDLSTEGGERFLAAVDVTISEGDEPIPGVIAIQQEVNRIVIVIAAPATTADTIQPLIDRLVEKIQIISTDGGPDLGQRTLQLIGPAVETQLGEYALGYGAPMRLITQSDAAFDAIGQRWEPATDGYQQIQIVTGGGGARYGVQTVVLGFDSEEEASAWFQGAFDRQAQFLGQTDIQPDDEFPSIGDESTSLTYYIENGNGVRQAVVRVGATVAVIDILALQMVDRQLLVDMSTIQADCLANLCEPQEPPASFGIDTMATPVPPEATPEASPTVEPAGPDATPVERAATPVVDSEQVASEDLYGLQVPYGDEWQLIGQSVEGTRSSIDLTNGIATVSIVGDSAHAGNPKTCFDDALVYLETVKGATQVTEVRDANDNPTYVETERSVQGIYTYLNAENEPEAAIVYCTILVDGEVTMLTIGSARAADFPAQLPIIADLIEMVRAPTS
jgi:hypothetical protein